MTDEEIREMEWAATYLTTHERPKGCRCAGSCHECVKWREASLAVAPKRVLRLIKHAQGQVEDVTRWQGHPDPSHVHSFVNDVCSCGLRDD